MQAVLWTCQNHGLGPFSRDLLSVGFLGFHGSCSGLQTSRGDPSPGSCSPRGCRVSEGTGKKGPHHRMALCVQMWNPMRFPVPFLDFRKIPIF